jgi:N-carbamoyl-L-amino-acid hydrolase
MASRRRNDTPARGVRIDEARLWGSLADLAQFGATPLGGVRRLAFTPEDRAARAHFVSQCQALDMRVERDGIGNLFATLPCASDAPLRASVMVGSHIDSQATGGKYDGAYGVMCALEIARTLRDQGVALHRPFEIAVWANEEGARFAPPMMGSGVFVGRFNLEEMRARVDSAGIALGDDLDADAASLSLPARPCRPIRAYFEPHIEQGPVLEHADVPIGIVVAAQAVSWLDLHVEGFSTHAGPTPLPQRRDALLSAAEIALAAEAVALSETPHARATIGQIAVTNPARNVVPGDVTLWLDLRHPDEAMLDLMTERIRTAALEIAARRRVSVSLDQIWRMGATRFDAALVEAFRASAKDNGVPALDMISGAGHDALHLALHCPAAMLFTPCEGGISHNETENMRREHAGIACQVLLDALGPLLTAEAALSAT